MSEENNPGLKSKLDAANRQIRALLADIERLKKMNRELAFENVKYRHANLSFKNCATYEGGSVFVVFAAKGADRFEVADALFDSLKEDDE